MIRQKLRKVGNSYVVTIPRAEVERQQLSEGQLVAVEIQPLDVRPRLAEDLRAALVRTWKKDEPAYRYLGGEDPSS
jgi:antitoxin component of MazEF toxin-antitoxin module